MWELAFTNDGLLNLQAPLSCCFSHLSAVSLDRRVERGREGKKKEIKGGLD